MGAWDDADDAELWDYDFEERAAILEYDAGLTRAEAERVARRMIAEDRQRQEEALKGERGRRWRPTNKSASARSATEPGSSR